MTLATARHTLERASKEIDAIDDSLSPEERLDRVLQLLDLHQQVLHLTLAELEKAAAG